MQLGELNQIILVSSTDVTRLGSQELSGTPYAAHKAAVEKRAKLLAEQLNAPISILRLGPLYGPGESKYNRLIPTWIRLRSKGEALNFSGEEDFRRNYLFVRDAAWVVAELSNLRSLPSMLNFEGAVGVTASEIRNEIERSFGQILRGVDGPLWVPPKYHIDGDRVNLDLFTTLETGIRMEIEALEE
jgi:nucleoside-diphosphate-sugar epimerase